MPRPIEDIAPFEGKAAGWLVDYLENTKPDSKRRKEQEEIDAKLLAHVIEPEPIRELPTPR